MGYINQVQKGQEVTDIQDIRMPNITNADVGKYLKVKDDLSLEFAEVSGGGGTQLYKHAIDIAYSEDGEVEDTFYIYTTKSTAFTKLSETLSYSDYEAISYIISGLPCSIIYDGSDTRAILTALILEEGSLYSVTIYTPGTGFTDTVTAL